MATLDIIVKPKLKFSLKRCGEVVPYGITPEEKAKLAGIEENANDYTHPETHPSSILDVVDVVNGAANKFLNERGEMVAVAHEILTDKNSEAAFQHIDTTTTKPALDAADMVAIKDSVTGKMVLTPKSNFDSPQLIVDYTHTSNKETTIESIDFQTSTITSTSHGLTNGTRLFAATDFNDNVLTPRSVLPNGMDTGIVYYVVNRTDNTFQLSLTNGGVSISITDKATKDYSKWHFEWPLAVDFISLPNLNKCEVVITGRSFEQINPAAYARFYKNELLLLNGSDIVWIAGGIGNRNAAGTTTARALFDLASKADIYMSLKMSIDFSLQRCQVVINGIRFRSTGDTTMTADSIANSTYIHYSAGDINFDKMQLSSIFNGTNIKIYKL